MKKKWILILIILVIIGMKTKQEIIETIYEPEEESLYIEGEYDRDAIQAAVQYGCNPLTFNVFYVGNKITDSEFNNLVNIFDNMVSYSTNNLLDAKVVNKKYIKRNSGLSNDELYAELRSFSKTDGGMVFSEYFTESLGHPITKTPYDTWIINTQISTNPTYLSNVAVHEIGHGIGLAHNNDINDVMNQNRDRYIKPRFNDCSLNYIENEYLKDNCYGDKLCLCKLKMTCNFDTDYEESGESMKISNETMLMIIGGVFLFILLW